MDNPESGKHVPTGSALQTSQKSGLLKQYLPFLEWLPNYRKRDFPGDLIAGMTVAVMIIPQSMAYAVLAGLPPVTGLYASMLPLLIYGLLGSTRILSLGPTAITSVMVLSFISGTAQQGTEAYIVMSLTLALTLGAVFVLMGVFRLGFIVNLLSEPVLVGYVNAAAIIILASQVQNLTGITAEGTSNPISMLLLPFQQLNNIQIPTLILGICCIGILLFFKFQLGKLLAKTNLNEVLQFSITRLGPLAVVIVGGVLVYVFNLNETQGIQIIGDIPAGLPSLFPYGFNFSQPQPIVLGAISIAFVGFMEGISTAKSLTSQRRDTIDANQELLAMGAANLAAAATGGVAVTTSISRSAVNYEAGANSGLSAVIASGVVTIVVLILTPYFYYLPEAALAAIIIVSVSNLFNFKSVRQLWSFSPLETIPFIATFFTVLFVSIEIGILVGIITAIVLHLWQTVRPRIVSLGRVGYSEYYRDITLHDTMRIPKTLIFRIDESLYFANMQYLDKQLRNAVAEEPELRYLILVFTAVNSIDASALQILEDLIKDLHEAGVEVFLSEIKPNVFERLRRILFIDQIGSDRIFETTHKAVQATNQLPDSELPL